MSTVTFNVIIKVGNNIQNALKYWGLTFGSTVTFKAIRTVVNSMQNILKYWSLSFLSTVTFKVIRTVVNQIQNIFLNIEIRHLLVPSYITLLVFPPLFVAFFLVIYFSVLLNMVGMFWYCLIYSKHIRLNTYISCTSGICF